jgi:hypothetical protein
VCAVGNSFSQDGGQADLSKNLHASLFNKGLWNELISARSISLDSTIKKIGKKFEIHFMKNKNTC